MDGGLIPLNVHAALDPLIAVLFVAAPWIFGFSGTTSAAVVSVVVGVVILVAGATTDWRRSLVRLIRLRTHLALDLATGAILIISPLVFGFSHEGGPTRFMIIAGALEASMALLTRWDPNEAAPLDSRERRPPRRRPRPALH